MTNAWSQISPFEHLLASHGFLVWSLDNRGTARRGTAFESATFRDLGRVELEDQLAGVEYLKSLPFVDPARIGITGGSYGGYMTLYAVTNAPDVFRAGVAVSSVTDWKLYDSIYTERYMGTPEGNPKGYETSSPLLKAGQLKADLLLIHGSADDNVHLANTLAVRLGPHQGGQAVRAAGPPPAAPRVPAEGGPHRARPRHPRPLREDAAPAVPRPRPPPRRGSAARQPRFPAPGTTRSRRPKAASNRSSRPRTPHEASAGTATTSPPPRDAAPHGGRGARARSAP